MSALEATTTAPAMAFDSLLARAKVVPTCKVCRLADLDRELYRQVHELYFYRSASLQMLAELVNPLVAQRKLGLRPFTKLNFQVHLRGHRGRDAHIPAFAHAAAEIHRAARQPVSVRHEQAAGPAQRTAAEQGAAAQVNIYREGSSLYADLSTVHTALRQKMEAAAKDGYARIDPKTLTTYLAVIRELRGLLGELGRIQSVDKLLTAVTAATVRDLSFDYLNDLAVHLQKLIPDPVLQASVREAIGMTLARHARAAVHRVREGDIKLD